MRCFLLITLLIFSSYFTSFSQTRRSSTTKKVVDKPAESKGKSETSKDASVNSSNAGSSNKKEAKISSESFLGETLRVESSKEERNNKSTIESKTTPQSLNASGASTSNINDTSKKGPSIANTSAVAHGEARISSAAVAKNYKFKADERSVEYYNDLRKKFDEEEKIRKEKEALQAIENAKKEEEVKQGRRLPEEQAPQFDKYRQGAKNAEVKKTSAEEDYKTLFK